MQQFFGIVFAVENHNNLSEPVGVDSIFGSARSIVFANKLVVSSFLELKFIYFNNNTPDRKSVV